MKANPWVTKTISILLLLLASVSLFLAQSSYWVNHTVFNQENFSSLVHEAVLEQSSRDAVAAQVVDRALQNRPVAERVIGDRAEKLVSSLLGSDFSSQAINKIVNVTYTYITTPDRQDIKIELAGIKEPILTVLNLAQRGEGEAAQRIESVPDEIVLVESDEFVDLSGAVSAMLWIGPLFWLLTIGSFALYIYLHRFRYAKAVYIVGASIVVVAITGVLTRPVLPAPISSLVPVSNLRPIVENVTDAFLVPFQVQMVSMLVVTLIALIIFSQRYRIARGVQKLGSMISRETVPVSEKPTAGPEPTTRKEPAKKK